MTEQNETLNINNRDDSIEDLTDDLTDENTNLGDDVGFFKKAMEIGNPFRGLIISLSIIFALGLITALFFVFSDSKPELIPEKRIGQKQDVVVAPSNVVPTDTVIDTKNKRYIDTLKVAEKEQAETAANNGSSFIPLPRTKPKKEKTAQELLDEKNKLARNKAAKRAKERADAKLNRLAGKTKNNLETPTLKRRSLPDSPASKLRAAPRSDFKAEQAKEKALNDRINNLSELAINMLGDSYISVGGTGMVTTEGLALAASKEKGVKQNINDTVLLSADSTKKESDLLQANDYEVMSPGDLFFGSLTTAVNSDIPTVIRAEIDTGIFAGGVAIGAFERNREWMAIKFNTVSINGKTYPIEWYAINMTAETAEDFVVAVKGNVDNHFWSKYFFTLAGSWLAGYGEAFANSGVTQQTASGSSILIRNPGAVAKDAALAKTGEALVRLMSEEASRPITVTIPAGTPLGLIAIKPVMSSEYDVSGIFKTDFNPSDVVAQ